MKKIYNIMALIMIFALVLTACGAQATTAPTAPPTVATKEVIKIGGLFDFTGPVADLGPKFQAGVELALEEVNYTVAGHKIELLVEDTATSVDVAVEKFKKLADADGVKIFIGPLMGDAHLAISPLAKEKNVLITSIVNGMYQTVQDGHYLIYPTTVDAQTYPFGQYAYDTLGYKSAVVVAADYAGKRGYAAGFIEGFKASGGTIVQEIYTPLGSPDYSPFISTIKEADVVMYALEGPGPVARFITQFKQTGRTTPMITITQDGDYTPEALAELKDVALGIKGEASYTWKLDNPENKKFVEGIMAKTGMVPSASEQNTYTLMKVILAGLEKTGGDVSFDKLFPAITSLKMNTPAGSLSFGPEGIAITPMYVTEAEKVGDVYEISAPLFTVPQVFDVREEP